MDTCCYSAQEAWHAEGTIPRRHRPRTWRIHERLRSQPVVMDIHRGLLFTQSFRQTEGMFLPLRWALALLHVAQNIPVVIGPDDLIVGRMTGQDGRRSILYPELEASALPDLKDAHLRKASPFSVTPDDYKIIMEEIYPFWKERNYAKAFVTALPHETRRFIYGEDETNYTRQQFILATTTTARSSLNYSHDYATILRRGLDSFYREAREKRDLCSADPAQLVTRGLFWDSMLVVIQALQTIMERYGRECERLAQQESDPVRRTELATIAANCLHLRHDPPETFWQALQLQWFVIMFARLEQDCGTSLSSGRMDQNLYPYYKRDLEAGRLNRDQARELLECYWLNFACCPNVKTDATSGKVYEAYAHFEAVTIGGLGKDGKDGTNDLTWLILETRHAMPSTYPDLAVRIHAGTPHDLLAACADLIKEGQGFPKLFNDEEIIPLYMAKGASRQQALDYACAGCVEARVEGETYVNGCGRINLAALVEMTLRDGRLRKLGDRRVGPSTGDPLAFHSFQEFFAALRTQYEHALRHTLIQQMIADQVKPRYLAAPFCSLLVRPCREAACDIHQYVPDSFREIFVDQVGFATLVDSVTAIKKLVFDSRAITMKELLQALDDDFQGHEALREALRSAPKFGRNDAYADAVGKELDEIICAYLHQHKGLHGESFSSRLVPITSHVPSGAVIGATPDGRKAGVYLSEGTSPAHGQGNNGPTAVLLSNKAAKNEGYSERAAWLLNIKLTPALVKGEEGTERLIAFIRSWCDLRLWHVQFNVINQKTLIAARDDPDSYRDIIVRVAGYSAYFTELTPMLQNEIIERTEFS